jgi:glucose/arabinose dehydrogenase
MKKFLLPCTAIFITMAGLFLSPHTAFAQPKIQLVNFASGFDLPLDITHCGDSRLFVVERDGVIWVLDSLGNRLDTFLNIDPRVNSGQNEQGLLGLAFDPNYASNGYFYVDYTKNTTGNTRVARFSVKPDNPNEADPNSEFTILEQFQPNWNHNGGCLKFGPDGYLYISLGDGGGANDPSNYAQNKKNLLGKILRIDVKNSNASQPYQVPADNPFVGNADYLPEIWSLGWRNPWRYSFDRLTGDMWIGDVGQNLWEEVDFEPANTPGLNYGWRCYEGTKPFNTSGCQPASNYVSPFFDYSHSAANGCSVTGGFIYRGNKYPDLYGCYLFADFCSGRWWYTKRNSNGTFTTNVLANLGGYEFSSFGEDRDGELYVALLNSGKVQKVRELCSSFQISTASFVGTSCQDGFSGLIELSATGATGAVTYKWSDGKTDAINVYLNPGVYNVEVKDGNGCIRRDTFEIVRIGPDKPTISVSDTILCPNGSVQLTAGNLTVPGTLRWFKGANIVSTINTMDTSATLIVTEPGEYMVMISDTICNQSSGTVKIGLDPLITPELSTAGDTVFSSQPCGTCQWYFNGQPIPGATGNFYVAAASGNYSLTLTSPNGCTVSSGEISVIGTETKLPASVRRLSIAPNPTENNILLELEIEKTSRINISMTDSSQRQVYAKALDSQKVSLPIDLSNLPVGTYFLSIKTEGATIMRKVIKK